MAQELGNKIAEIAQHAGAWAIGSAALHNLAVRKR